MQGRRKAPKGNPQEEMAAAKQELALVSDFNQIAVEFFIYLFTKYLFFYLNAHVQRARLQLYLFKVTFCYLN